MSWLSKAAKRVEKTVSRAATKIGVGNDLKKAVNVFGAANVGGAVGVVTGFLTGGVTGAYYGAVTGATTAAVGKYKGNSSSKYLSNAAGNAAIAGSVGPLIYKPASAAVITAPGPVSGYANSAGQITVKTSSGGFLGNIVSGTSNVFKDALSTIGKGGLTKWASDGLAGLFGSKPANPENPDYQQGNAVAPGDSFGGYLSSILGGKGQDPINGGVTSAGGASPTTNVSVVPGESGGFMGLGFNPYVLGAVLIGGGFLLLSKKSPLLKRA